MERKIGVGPEGLVGNREMARRSMDVVRAREKVLPASCGGPGSEATR